VSRRRQVQRREGDSCQRPRRDGRGWVACIGSGMDMDMSRSHRVVHVWAKEIGIGGCMWHVACVAVRGDAAAVARRKQARNSRNIVNFPALARSPGDRSRAQRGAASSRARLARLADGEADGYLLPRWRDAWPSKGSALLF
jgi:hypothetical protein